MVTRLLAVISLVGGLVTCTQAAQQTPVEGRITADVTTVWACPLEDWNLGRDAACDPLMNGTAVRIHQRGVRPEYRHGPFAKIEYEYEGARQVKYVKNLVVTPLGEKRSTLDDDIREMQEAVKATEAVKGKTAEELLDEEIEFQTQQRK